MLTESNMPNNNIGGSSHDQIIRNPFTKSKYGETEHDQLLSDNRKKLNTISNLSNYQVTDDKMEPHDEIAPEGKTYFPQSVFMYTLVFV